MKWKVIQLETIVQSTIVNETGKIYQLSIENKKNKERRRGAKKCKIALHLAKQKESFNKLVTELEIRKTEKYVSLMNNSFTEALGMLKGETEFSAFHLFQNTSLFVTSLLLYILLNNKMNEAWIIGLIDNEKTKKRKLKDRIHIQFSEMAKTHKMLNTFTDDHSGKVNELFFQKDFLPKYSTSKKIAGYRSELARTLCGGKIVKFKNREVLDQIANNFLHDDMVDSLALLLLKVGEVRYDLLSRTPMDLYEFTLSDNGNDLVLNHMMAISNKLIKINFFTFKNR